LTKIRIDLNIFYLSWLYFSLHFFTLFFRTMRRNHVRRILMATKTTIPFMLILMSLNQPLIRFNHSIKTIINNS